MLWRTLAEAKIGSSASRQHLHGLGGRQLGVCLVKGRGRRLVQSKLGAKGVVSRLVPLHQVLVLSKNSKGYQGERFVE